MRQLFVYFKLNNSKFLLPALILIIAGCSLEKKNGLNRSLQNLTAHYNILFNANEILRLKQESYAAAFPDAYSELLSVYPDTTTQSSMPDKDLEDAIVKANKIINIKEQSHYLGDAYLVLGKARYLEANYFDAEEYFNYVTRSYGQQQNLKQEALVWKARALMYLNQLPEAKTVIDSAMQDINPKKTITADVYATRLQYDINTKNYTEAQEMAVNAIKYCSKKLYWLRWIYILAQLQELNQQPDDAYLNYTRIVNSNSSFEMAFNANLNRIRIKDNQNGIKISKIALLRSLLKNSDNRDFNDQVYYQIANQYYLGGDIDNAIKNFKLSVRKSTKNQNQKGLSYLRIADIEFKNKANYASAKLYYDSTLTYLSINYPGYQIIRKKSNNLQILTKLLETISREDTLQMLALLDDKTRAARIDAMAAREAKRQQQAAAIVSANSTDPFDMVNTQPVTNNNVKQNTQTSQNNSGSTFYFYNANAISQGYNDFVRLWGNRKLEDDWRRSKRSDNGLPANTGLLGNNAEKDTKAASQGTANNNNLAIANEYKQQLTKDIPLTPARLAQSNFRIYNAYFEMGNFYRDVLEDKKEAINTYELLLTRFPGNQDKPAIYYNLYRLYTDIDAAKSNLYKNLLLKSYPESVFAKVILDPDYTKKLDDVDAEFNGFYNQVFELYQQKQYPQVISRVNELVQKYPDNHYAAQLYYLRAIAGGHQEKMSPFIADLQQIASKYPQDALITPLVNQHLAYIDSNKAEMAARSVILTDDDTGELPFTPPVAYQKQTEYRPLYKPAPQSVITPPEKRPERVDLNQVKAPVNNTLTAGAIKQIQPLIVSRLDMPAIKGKPDTAATVPAAQNAAAAPAVNYIFSKEDSTDYYFVVHVSSGTSNLASSRFGIGQFIRTHYAGSTIRHGLVTAGRDDQLIYIGRFYSLAEEKDYARAIIPLMPDIMKVSKDKYSFFIITKENLDKLADQKTLNSYIDYYQKFY